MKQKSSTITVGNYVCVRPSYIQQHIAPEARARYQSIRGFVSAVRGTASISVVSFNRKFPSHNEGALLFPLTALMAVPPLPSTDARSFILDHRV